MQKEGTDFGGSILPVMEVVPWSEQYLQDMRCLSYSVSLDNLITFQVLYLVRPCSSH